MATLGLENTSKEVNRYVKQAALHSQAHVHVLHTIFKHTERFINHC
jgi:predicted metal-dependent hydrolase